MFGAIRTFLSSFSWFKTSEERQKKVEIELNLSETANDAHNFSESDTPEIRINARKRKARCATPRDTHVDLPEIESEALEEVEQDASVKRSRKRRSTEATQDLVRNRCQLTRGQLGLPGNQKARIGRSYFSIDGQGNIILKDLRPRK
ncbi:hypothetical protein L596_022164 [Steinernema carpocapsae]|uniref:Uncharacterized protein n=1 Tax=Steinernema carpocapsae TaxID=34508 RepID=A0A4U5ML00_STECR|nr:hypothetical protein L596_022164 [Steinernema carpocapsae]